MGRTRPGALTQVTHGSLHGDARGTGLQEVCMAIAPWDRAAAWELLCPWAPTWVHH